jgi:hypothetical protein
LPVKTAESRTDPEKLMAAEGAAIAAESYIFEKEDWSRRPELNR